MTTKALAAWLCGWLLAASAAAEPACLDPVDLAVTPDGDGLAVACAGSGSLLLLSSADGAVRGEVAIGPHPSAVAVGAAGERAYVTSRDGDFLAVVDLGALEVVETIAVGWSPSAVLLDRGGRRAFVANGSTRDLSVVDLERGLESKRLRAGERPRALALSPDGRWLYVANLLSGPHDPGLPPVPELTVVDAGAERVVGRIPLPGANVVQDVAAGPGVVLLPLIRPKNLVPLVQVAGGWTITNGLGVVPVAGGSAEPPAAAVQLLLDGAAHHYADPTAVAIDPRGGRAYLAAGGADRLLVLDLEAVSELAAGVDPAASALLADRLDLAGRFVTAALPTGPHPVALALSPDGSRLFVADRLGDSVTVVDTGTPRVAATYRLGGTREPSAERRGERLFYSAAATFHAQFSCASCHPDSDHDGLVYDISPDGLGRNLVDTRTMFGLPGTAPFKWSGLNPDLHTQCGPRAAMFIMRSPGFGPAELDDVVAFMASLSLPRNRLRQPGAALTPIQEWGKRIFERTVDNTGRRIGVADRCTFCHSGPRFTNNRRFDVGTAAASDDSGLIDTPSLNYLLGTAPYLHDGRALTLEEIWTRFSPDDRHGRANDLGKDELNALVEYLKTL